VDSAFTLKPLRVYFGSEQVCEISPDEPFYLFLAGLLAQGGRDTLNSHKTGDLKIGFGPDGCSVTQTSKVSYSRHTDASVIAKAFR
jgi:hypothetical protein